MNKIMAAANDDANPVVDPARIEAAMWVARLTSGEATSDEQEEFRRWRDSERSHAAALVEARSLWLALGPAIVASKARSAARPWSSHFRVGVIAASLAFAMIGGFAASNRYGHDYATGAGELRTIALADGTRVTLAGSTAIDASIDRSGRRVTLARGEAYFDVVHNPTLPFTVDVGLGHVKDIGTAFSVRRDGSRSAVEVARGKVEVSNTLSHRVVMLTANQGVDFDASNTDNIRAADAAKDLSWINGRLIIESKTLSVAVDDINRYYAGHIILLSDASNGRKLSAVIDLGNIDDWLAALDRTGTAKVTKIGNLVLLH